MVHSGWKRTLTLLSVVAGFTTLAASQAQPADPGHARLIRDKSSSSKLASLSFDQDLIPVTVHEVQGQLLVLVEIEGRFQDPTANLIVGDSTVDRDSQGRFSKQIRLHGKSSMIQFSSVDQLGNVRRETVIVDFPGWGLASDEDRSGLYHVSVGMGVGVSKYENPRITPYSALGVFGKVGITSPEIKQRWSLHANMYSTLLAAGSSAYPGITARFIGINLRAGYLIPLADKRWNLRVWGGAFYTTMLVSNDRFGYKNVSGPQLYPMVRRLFPKNRSAYAYVKFSPLSDRFTLLELSSHEIATGVGYGWLLSNHHGLSIGIDWSKIDLVLSGKQSGSQSYSLGISYDL